jgi:hypothetical protein
MAGMSSRLMEGVNSRVRPVSTLLILVLRHSAAFVRHFVDRRYCVPPLQVAATSVEVRQLRHSLY